MRVNVTMHRTPCAAPCRALVVLLLSAAGLAAAPARLAGQAGLTGAENATPVPRGMLRLSLTPSWMRYDSRFDGSGGIERLGDVLTAEALGTAELPALTTFESALRHLTGDADFRLSLGRALTTASVRVVRTPILLEYGITPRVSIGVTVPIVQRQRELILDIDPRGPLSTGNVGPLGSAVRPQVYAQASQLAQAVEAAAAALTQRISQCGAAPTGSGCAAITADPAGATATVIAGRQVAMSVRYVYGTDAAAPAAIGLVPHVGLTATINAQLEALNTRFATYLGGTPIATRTAPAGAQGAATAADLRAITQAGVAGLGPDSLARVAKIGIGDVEIGARLLVWDTNPVTSAAARAPGLRTRVMLGVLARLGTGEPARDDELFGVGAGDGQADAEVNLAADVDGIGRLGATVLARYTRQLGEVAATRMPDDRGNLTPFGATAAGSRTLGDVLAIEATPRYRLGNSLYIVGHYAMLTRGDDHYSFPRFGAIDDAPLIQGLAGLPEQATAGGYTEQRAGLGLTYSTVAEWERGNVSVPIDVSYVHMETFSGSSAMVPRAGRDQIQVRLYYRLRR